MNIKFSDEQSTKLRIGECWSTTIRFSCWCMQDFYVWDHALLRNQCQTRMLLVSYLFFIEIIFDSSKRFFRFNGVSFQTEPSSTFPHEAVVNLGSYRQSPFVTGGKSLAYGLKTEIFDRTAEKWTQADDYPFANSDM